MSKARRVAAAARAQAAAAAEKVVILGAAALVGTISNSFVSAPMQKVNSHHSIRLAGDAVHTCEPEERASSQLVSLLSLLVSADGFQAAAAATLALPTVLPN
eukprot:2958284-Amphidinium_carterae.1